MTILPKKKATKDKSDSENTEHSGCTVGHPHPHGHSHNHTHSHSLTHPHSHGHYHHTTATETRHDKTTRSRTSPTRWGPSTSRDEKLTPARSHTSSTAFDFDFDNHDTASNHKRRHRSSPHRTVRKHRGHTNSSQSSPGTSSTYDLEDAAYNSEDEHCTAPKVPENREELEIWFEQALKENKGYIIKKMGEDGACLFRAVADQIYGDQEMNSSVRNMCIDYMAKNAEFFSQYVTEDFKTYLNRKRMDNCHGNHLEIQAIAELFNRPVEVYQYSIEPINTFHSAYKTDNEPIRISYHGGVHYNSVVDPRKATIGVGLGLPGYQPGLADRNLMEKALKHSEDHHLEKAMLEDKLRETDWELTQDSIEEQVARESYLQWLRDQEAASKQGGASRSASATCSSSEYSRLMEGATGSPEARTSRSPRNRSGQNSPQHPTAIDHAVPGSSKSPRNSPKQQANCDVVMPVAGASEAGAAGGFSETSSLMDHLPPAMFDWDEDDILAQVMAVSHQEYLDSLKRQASSSTTPSSSATATSATLASATIVPDHSMEQACCSTSGDSGLSASNS
ncbi:hypothetical protein BaRGS_00020177 [Batillaria attramentaria]|uniref:ubiquitinyl hydrolase 1 n=1 Tax=Batillaria attramentaria TaxID=370345 RepID=A0ABD0KP40_9CAEN